jgi:hypothetical protein
MHFDMPGWKEPFPPHRIIDIVPLDVSSQGGGVRRRGSVALPDECILVSPIDASVRFCRWTEGNRVMS